MIAVTIDIDWACDEILNDCLALLERYDVRATLFCTHALEAEGHELAIHPNYSRQESFEETIGKLKALFPQARGIRAHSLLFGSRMYPLYRQYGLVYDSNYFLYGQADLRPFIVYDDVLELPIYFADDAHLSMSQAEEKFGLAQFDLAGEGLKVFAFHPIHIFLNTRDYETYERARPFYHQPDRLRDLCATDEGTRALFIRLLEYLHQTERYSYTLGEINDIWRREHALPGVA